MDNKAQPELSPELVTKKISLKRLQVLQEVLGAATDPDMFDWDVAEIPDEGSDKLLSALQEYRSAFQVLKKEWKAIYGEELR